MFYRKLALGVALIVAVSSSSVVLAKGNANAPGQDPNFSKGITSYTIVSDPVVTTYDEVTTVTDTKSCGGPHDGIQTRTGQSVVTVTKTEITTTHVEHRGAPNGNGKDLGSYQTTDVTYTMSDPVLTWNGGWGACQK